MWSYTNKSDGDTGGQTTKGNIDPNSSKSRRSKIDERKHRNKIKRK